MDLWKISGQDKTLGIKLSCMHTGSLWLTFLADNQNVFTETTVICINRGVMCDLTILTSTKMSWHLEEKEYYFLIVLALFSQIQDLWMKCWPP